MRIETLPHHFSVCKVEDYSETDMSSGFFFTGVTDRENSLVCPTSDVPSNTTERDDGWMALRISGQLDLSLIGILSRILTVLADRDIGIFAISTFDTDYILVRSERYEDALSALEDAGYHIDRSS